jgi:hypothetical protein
VSKKKRNQPPVSRENLLLSQACATNKYVGNLPHSYIVAWQPHNKATKTEGPATNKHPATTVNIINEYLRWAGHKHTVPTRVGYWSNSNDMTQAFQTMQKWQRQSLLCKHNRTDTHTQIATNSLNPIDTARQQVADRLSPIERTDCTN